MLEVRRLDNRGRGGRGVCEIRDIPAGVEPQKGTKSAKEGNTGAPAPLVRFCVVCAFSRLDWFRPLSLLLDGSCGGMGNCGGGASGR